MGTKINQMQDKNENTYYEVTIINKNQSETHNFETLKEAGDFALANDPIFKLKKKGSK